MEPSNDFLTQQDRDRQEAQSLVSQPQLSPDATLERGASSSDLVLVLGFIVLALVGLLALKFKQPTALTPAAPAAVIAQQQAPAPVVNAAYIQWDTSLETAMQRARAVNKPIMIDFYTDWCGACKWMESEVYTNQQVMNEAQHFVNVKINAEQYTDLADKYNIHSYPTFVFIDANGNTLGSESSVPPPAEFIRLLQRYRPA